MGIKKYIYIAIAVIILLMGIFGVVVSIQNHNLKKDYSTAVQNNKAYESQMDSLNQLNKVFLYTIDQLQYTNDSSFHQLDSLRKQLKIKDNKIKQMGKIREYIHVHDTLTIHDTIFSKPDFVLDTCIGDKWVENCIHLEYPNKISSETSVNTDLSVFMHITRETIKPPCKTWIGRLFLRKHDVYNITVIDNNEHATIKENKFVIIND